MKSDFVYHFSKKIVYLLLFLSFGKVSNLFSATKYNFLTKYSLRSRITVY
ncbi:hypothetical protein HMPREF1383_01461 [Enterococcus faecium V689]|uniref:Uncharacterized protein n=1 Tax=Enterococcus faecium R496 TaxID=1134836 RepID=A0AAV3GZ57_ENTFC|nr:hypothetical protein HMPREF9526_01971 [Enterococcus faecium TX0133B]EFR73519.1 hypothetical protein HMPREF9523_02584 [Enterococcus faecium TX0133A]EFR76273.1 hypothetical protein HMPREF9527_02929 [Enterococcus faecium TX0133C]EFS10093.1 hypothetical protein HMPREF9522_00589 [Enterococcus faecium TX0082]EJX41121.1 hypothetical protein HMPREF1383_01461 [Enterococcus faecium V689]EJX43044.1 hypothetical protein HMPREF1382_01209 [Enterococcus faecium S447]EJX46088.1 hypothetical protein HMPREF